MARRPRIDFAGYHHLVNRGVARMNVYNGIADKEKFLEILCKACRDYQAMVHDYCLMDNHYHLLLETRQENLSLLMRQVNSNYATFFNKKYNRSGHLWQGRYKSWYITQEAYLYMLLRYIEYNPVKAKMASSAGEYPYTFAHTLLNKNQIPCTEGSILTREFPADTLQEFLELDLTEEELAQLKQEQKRAIVLEDDNSYRQLRSMPLEKHFEDVATKQERNCAIVNAFADGHTQASIAKYLEVSTGLVSMVIRKN